MNLQTGGAERLGFVIPLTKIDVEKRLVYGVAALEEPDKAREIFDYTTSKPFLQKWSEGYEQATGGLSRGNLRAMHNPRNAAGVFKEIAFDDAAKRVAVCAHVTDDHEWKKTLAGTYTGFSLGGGYAKRWDDPELPNHKRYTALVSEISLVDNPCMPNARFAELIKVDGSVTQLPLVGVDQFSFDVMWKRRPKSFAELWAERQQRAEPPSFAELWAARL